ncbi:MAG TPA: hypothetical protein VK828_14995 [Terriglobales bacterium]|nr:hypothetical protein [Terriglobales bacterium]
MSSSAVSGASIYQEIQSFYQTRQSDVKQLGSALQNGDLSGAQTAFAELTALGQSGPFANSEPFAKSTRDQAFNTIGQDLQAGDLAGAQAAFATLTAKGTPQLTPPSTVNLDTPQLTPPSQVTLSSTTATGSIYQQLQAYRQQRTADLAQLGQDLQAGNLTAAQTDFNTLTALGQSGPYKSGQTFQRSDRNQDFQTIGQALQTGNVSLAQSAYSSLAGSFGGQNKQAANAISAYSSNAEEIVINISSNISSNIGPPSTGTTAVPFPIQSHNSTTPAVTPTTTTSTGSNLPEIVINVGGASSTAASTGSATPELVINLDQGGSFSANAEDVRINLAGNSGAQVSIAPIQEQNGSSAEEVTINLGANSPGAQLSINSPGTNGNSPQPVTVDLNPQTNYEVILNLLNATTQDANNPGALLNAQA